MAYERCPSCKGKKTILAIGNMMRKCPTCKGVGHVAVAEHLEVIINNDHTLILPEQIGRIAHPDLVSDNVSRETCAGVTLEYEDVPVKIKKKPGRKPKVKSNFDIVLNVSQ